VVAAAVYPAGPFYRGDLVTERVAGARELADVLFGADGIDIGSPLRLEALRETNRLIEAISAAGAYHPDLNVKNVLVETGSTPLRVHLLDLDRCQVGGPRTAAAGRRMRRRLLRSTAKWEARTGHRLSGHERAALLPELER
jgi:hypothetical protein